LSEQDNIEDREDGSLSSIEKQEDEDGFDSSSEKGNEQVVEETKEHNIEHTVSNKLVEESADSDRLTFGCVTPTDEDHKVTFSNCGDASLSPVRTLKNYS
jgi:hypothetical protein